MLRVIMHVGFATAAILIGWDTGKILLARFMPAAPTGQ